MLQQILEEQRVEQMARPVDSHRTGKSSVFRVSMWHFHGMMMQNRETTGSGGIRMFRR